MSCPFQSNQSSSADLEAEFKEMPSSGQSALQQLDAIWEHVVRVNSDAPDNSSSPTVFQVGEHIMSSDYSDSLTSTADLHEIEKVLCAKGFVCRVRAVWFPGHSYSGLFQKSDFGIARFSTAMEPIAQSLPWYLSALPAIVGNLTRARLFPCAAIKMFRDGGHHSGNLLFGGRKTGEESELFFDHILCTSLTETTSIAVSWILNLFKKYSEYPTHLGTSDFASIGQEGEIPDAPRFPWAVALACPLDSPLRSLPFSDLCNVPLGTVLYDIFAIPSPGAACDPATSGLQRIGQLVSTSAMMKSNGRDGLRFKHQRKEEDYDIESDWPMQLTDFHRDFGPKYLQPVIEKNAFLDFGEL